MLFDSSVYTNVIFIYTIIFYYLDVIFLEHLYSVQFFVNKHLSNQIKSNHCFVVQSAAFGSLPHSPQTPWIPIHRDLPAMDWISG